MPRGGSANATVGIAQRNCRKVTRKVRVKKSKRRLRRERARERRRAKRLHRKPHRIKRYRVVKRKRWVKCGAVVVAGSRTRAADNGPPGEKCAGPYAAAFDQATGRVAWMTPPIDEQKGADVYGSPVFAGGVALIGVSGGSAELGDEADRYAFQGSMNFIDVNTGK